MSSNNFSNASPTVQDTDRSSIATHLPQWEAAPGQGTQETGEGTVRRWRLRPGLDLIIHNLTFRENVVIERNSAEKSAHLGISFCLSGSLRRLSDSSDQAIQLRAGGVSLGVTHEGCRRVEYAAGQRVSLIHLHIQPKVVSLFDEETVEQLPISLKRAIVGNNPAYFQSYPMTPTMTATVQQLLHCPYQGFSQRLYIESKTLELMSLYFDQLLSQTHLRQQTSNLKKEEVDRIFHARDILISRMDNPPTLAELAHQTGLNDRKLKQGFRQVFETTVFGYLYDYRMQQAQQLLLMPGTTIASVAQKVGHRNPEAFSVAFRRRFGTSPKAYQLQHR